MGDSTRGTFETSDEASSPEKSSGIPTWAVWVIVFIVLALVLVGLFFLVKELSKKPEPEPVPETPPTVVPPVIQPEVPVPAPKYYPLGEYLQSIEHKNIETVIGVSSETVPILTSDDEPIEDGINRYLDLSSSGMLTIQNEITKTVRILNTQTTPSDEERKYELMLKDNGKLCIYSDLDEQIWCSDNAENDKDGPYMLRFVSDNHGLGAYLDIADVQLKSVWKSAGTTAEELN